MRGCVSLREREVVRSSRSRGHLGEFTGRKIVRRMCIGLITVACCAMASAGIVNAQETINQATVSGRVLDSQGAAVPGATVSVRPVSYTHLTLPTILRV